MPGRRWCRRVVVVTANIAFVVACCLVAPAGARGAAPAQVRQAVDKAKAWLYAQQLPDRTWEHRISHTEQKTGQTALAVYALMSAGESRQDPRLAAAIDYLKKNDTTGVYALGLRCQVWLMLPPTEDVRQQLSKDARILLQSIKRGTDDASGFYDYSPGADRNYSHSRAQYAVLGLWAAAQSGLVEVPKEYWITVEKAWTGHQDASGAWAYQAKPNSQFPLTAGMTAVGVATLYITQDYVHSADAAGPNGGNVRNPAIERGTKWLADHFDDIASDAGAKLPRAYPFSTLYAVERIGVAGGTKYFNNVDWYAKGADWLISKQKPDGSFPAEWDARAYSTCMSLLFLSRGAAPVLMNKLDYSAAALVGGRKDDEPRWNQRSRDAANLARWVSRQVERELNWQIVTLGSPVNDWHDAPILYLSGNQNFTLAPEHEAKLKQFIEQGGLVLGSADGASVNFATAFRALGKKLFPACAPFAPLPDNHPIYAGQQFSRSKWKRKPTVLSMGNGARELMILLPDSDPARAWQLAGATAGAGAGAGAGAAAGREELFELPTNIFLYAVDKQNLRRRGESYLVAVDEKVKATRSLKLARLEHDGNHDPEPGGWRRLGAVMHNAYKLDLEVASVKPAAGALDGFAIAHVTGTRPFTFDAAARDAVKAFVQKGGTLVIDAAGGSSEFARAAEAELAAIFPDAAKELAQPLLADDALFTAGPAPKLATFGYRNFARAKLGQIKVPQLRGLRVNNRRAVLFSREDLSVGLVGQPVDGITGYDPETATAIMSRIVLHAAGAEKK